MYQEIPVLSFISAALCLVPLTWYLRTRNIAAVAIGIWLLMANLIYAIDALIWAQDSDIKVAVWCDITTVILTGANIALPAASLSICIHLERLASFSSSSQISTPQAKKRRILLECLTCVGVPFVYLALHLIVQPRRFDLFYGFGCRPATYPTITTIFIVVIPPLLLAIAVVAYSWIACRHLFVHRIQFCGKRGSISSLTRNLYLRLVGMAVLEAVFSAVSMAVKMRHVLSPGLSPIANMPRHLSEVLVWDFGSITDDSRTALMVEWLVTVLQSIAFFGLFACRAEVVRGGWDAIITILRRWKKPKLAFTSSSEQGDLEQSGSVSCTSVPALPTTVIDLTLVTHSSMLAPYDCSTDKSSVSTPGPSCPPTPIEEIGPEDVMIAIIEPGMVPLASPASSSAIASSHNSLASNFDPSRLDLYSPDAWPRTPTTIPVRLKLSHRHTCSVGYVSKQNPTQDALVGVRFPEYVVSRARSYTADFWAEGRRGLAMVEQAQ